jgi:hypothetical protein
MVACMQDRLFDFDRAVIDLVADPYAEQRAISKRLADGYGIHEDEAFGLLLAFGSERAVRATLKQRWWRGEIDRLDEQAA